MGRLLWRQAAIDDLDHIYDYIAEGAPLRAASFADELIEKARFLAANQHVGEARLPKVPDVRVFPHENYLLLFKPLVGVRGIELLRILHGAQDYLNSFTDDT